MNAFLTHGRRLNKISINTSTCISSSNCTSACSVAAVSVLKRSLSALTGAQQDNALQKLTDGPFGWRKVRFNNLQIITLLPTAKKMYMHLMLLQQAQAST